MAHQEDVFGQQTPASASLRQISSAHLHIFLDFSPDALLCLDRSGTIVMLNEHMATLFGYAEEELLGTQHDFLLPPRFRGAHLRHREQYFSAPDTRHMGAELDIYGLRKNGTEFPVDIRLQPLLLDGEPHALASVRDVTVQRAAKRQRAVQALHLNVLTDLINLAPDAILIRDPMSRIIFWNHGAEYLYGWSEQEALGRITHTLLETRFPQSRAAIETALEQQGQWEGELSYTCRDGHTVLVESRQALIRDPQGEPLAILEVNRDITERHRREQTERDSLEETVERETLFHQMLDSLPCGVFLAAGMDGRLLYANRAAQQVWNTQWPLQQPIGEFLRTNGILLLDPQGRPISEEDYATLRVLRTGEAVRAAQKIVRLSDGKMLPILVNAEPLSPPQRAGIPASEPVALVVYDDITTLKEEEKLKDEFTCIAAHELRTPLTILSGYVDMLLRQASRGGTSPPSEQQQKAIAAIKNATLRLSMLTDDLLDVTRLQAGRLVLQPRPTNIISLVCEIAAQFQQTTEQHRLEVLTPKEPVIATVDESRLKQILTNIIGNAIKYSPLGGPILIALEEDSLHQQVRIKVEDRGIGIPQHQQVRIFGRFIRAENAQAWEITGTGLGLYLCHELAALMGGNIWFNSKEGIGSTFFVSLPLNTKPEIELAPFS